VERRLARPFSQRLRGDDDVPKFARVSLECAEVVGVGLEGEYAAAGADAARAEHGVEDEMRAAVDHRHAGSQRAHEELAVGRPGPRRFVEKAAMPEVAAHADAVDGGREPRAPGAQEHGVGRVSRRCERVSEADGARGARKSGRGAEHPADDTLQPWKVVASAASRSGAIPRI